MATKSTAWDSLTSRNGFMTQQCGKSWSAPFTGFTWKAFAAYVHLVDAWYSGDMHNRERIESALRRLAEVFQPTEYGAIRMAIYGLGCETAMHQLWARIQPSGANNEKV